MSMSVAWATQMAQPLNFYIMAASLPAMPAIRQGRAHMNMVIVTGREAYENFLNETFTLQNLIDVLTDVGEPELPMTKDEIQAMLNVNAILDIHMSYEEFCAAIGTEATGDDWEATLFL
jgi:hypothetical protein